MTEEQHHNGTVYINKISKREDDIRRLKDLLSSNKRFTNISFENSVTTVSINSPDAINELLKECINSTIDTLEQEVEQYKIQFKAL